MERSGMSARTEHEKNSRTGGWLSRTAAFFQKRALGSGTEPEDGAADDTLHRVLRWLGAVIVILLLIYYCTPSVRGGRPENFYFEESENVCGDAALRCTFDPDTDAGAVK